MTAVIVSLNAYIINPHAYIILGCVYVCTDTVCERNDYHSLKLTVIKNGQILLMFEKLDY